VSYKTIQAGAEEIFSAPQHCICGLVLMREHMRNEFWLLTNIDPGLFRIKNKKTQVKKFKKFGKCSKFLIFAL
jgi:hypothetical protein